MAAAKHTPGPWSVEDPLGPELLSIVAGGPEAYNWIHIAEVAAGGNEEDGDAPKAQAKANAHLIAAAPEVLEALRAVMVGFRGVIGAVEIDEQTTRLNVTASGRPLASITIADLFQKADLAIAKSEGRI